MSHREIEDLKAWAESHDINWTQMKACNDYNKLQHDSCGGTGDIVSIE